MKVEETKDEYNLADGDRFIENVSDPFLESKFTHIRAINVFACKDCKAIYRYIV